MQRLNQYLPLINHILKFSIYHLLYTKVNASKTSLTLTELNIPTIRDKGAASFSKARLNIKLVHEV